MNRRRFLGMMGSGPLGGLLPATGIGALAAPMLAPPKAAAQTRPPPAEVAIALWEAWKEVHLNPDGRVIDRLQRNSSHSEGQGYGALLAAEFGDTEAFARIHDWTEANLAIRSDPLLAWRWLPDESTRVPDLNNASDGDLFYAWALIRAGRRFDDPRYLDRAAAIAEALARQCIITSPENDAETLLIPAVHGFVDDQRVVFNPSYLMPLAMRELSVVTGVAELALAAQHGEALLARLAQDGMVPDWVAISADGISEAEGFSASAGYEAIRVPLFLIWSGLSLHPAVVNARRVYDRTVIPGAPVPTRIEPVSGVVLEASEDPGYRAVAALVSCAAQRSSDAQTAIPGALMPQFDPSQPYYPATLHLFAMLATHQAVPVCTPI